MSFAGAITVIEAIMLAAAPEHSQQGGEPGIPARKTAAWFYVGTGENGLIGETLTDHPYEERLTIRLYWPAGTRAGTPSRTLELDVQARTRALVAALEGDRSLGENVSAVAISDAEAGWLEADGAAVRIVSLPIALGFTDLETISR